MEQLTRNSNISRYNRHFQKKTIDKFWQHQDILYDNLPNALTLGIRNFVQ